MLQIRKKPILLFIISAFCLLLPAGLLVCGENEEPSIDMIGNEYVLTLSEEQWSAIRSYNPEFQIRKQADYLPTLVKLYQFSEHQLPYAVIGDFNGDGCRDVVLAGYDKDNDLLIAVLSSNSESHVMEIGKTPLINPKTAYYGMGDHYEYGLSVCLSFVPQGKIDSPYEEHPLQLSTDAFELQFFERAAVLYYLKDSKFQRYITSD